jgi:hypothetical protein
MSDPIENTVIGYQYSSEDGRYIGEYPFPRNLIGDAIHLPPFTVLDAPPKNIPEGALAIWQGDSWVVNSDSVQLNKIQFGGVMFDTLLPEYIDDLRRAGLIGQLLSFYGGRPDLVGESILPVA